METNYVQISIRNNKIPCLAKKSNVNALKHKESAMEAVAAVCLASQTNEQKHYNRPRLSIRYPMPSPSTVIHPFHIIFMQRYAFHWRPAYWRMPETFWKFNLIPKNCILLQFPSQKTRNSSITPYNGLLFIIIPIDLKNWSKKYRMQIHKIATKHHFSS